MVPQKNIRIKKWFWNLIPWVNYQTMQAFYPNIYLPPKVYENLVSDNPNPYNFAHLLHEQTHIKRIEAEGKLSFMMKYAFSPKFRFDEEIKASEVAMKYIKSKGLTWNVDDTAKHLSSWLYFWPVSYVNARSKLTEIWNRLD